MKPSLLMVNVVARVVEWISLCEMIKLKELSTPISDVLREWQDREIIRAMCFGLAYFCRSSHPSTTPCLQFALRPSCLIVGVSKKQKKTLLKG